MKVRRFALILISSLCIFSGCHKMTSDLEDAIGTTCWSDLLYWEDVSRKNDYTFSGNNRFKRITDGGEPAIKVSSGSGNWVLSSLGRDIKGYEVKIRSDSSSASLIGCQLFSKSDYRAFEVYIKRNGSVEVRFQDKKGNDTKLFTSKKIISDITAYNTIALVLQDDRTMNVYCNGMFVYAIQGYSINYGQLAMQMNNSGNTYYKIRKVLH